MKINSATFFLIAILSPAALHAQAVGVPTAFTTPVGYSGESLQQGMNLVGFTLHKRVISLGTVSSITPDSVTLAESLPEKSSAHDLPLTPGLTYILEITTGAKAGVIQEITAWQGLRLTVAEDLGKAGVAAGDQFRLRRAATLNEVFDPRNTTLQSGPNPAQADVIFIPEGESFGQFRQCFILTSPDAPALWVDAATGRPVGNLPLVYPDGLIVQRKGTTPAHIANVGETKPGPTRSVIRTGFNLIATPSADSPTLQNIGLENDLEKNDNPTKADTVWLRDPNAIGGTFIIYHLDASGTWITNNSEPVVAPVPVGSAIMIQRHGPPALITLGD